MGIYFDFEIISEGNKIRFDVLNFTAREWISKPYEVSLELASPKGRHNENEIYFDNVIGKEALLTITSEYSEREERNPSPRYFHGIIRQFEKTGYDKNFDRVLYKASLVPELWQLSLRNNYRIFQNLPVLKKTEGSDPNSIVEEIFKTEFNSTGGIIRVEKSIQTEYPSRDYCSQFNETDLNFISRLLEEEGIFYYFKHSEEEHRMVFGDSYNNYDPSIEDVKFDDETDRATEDYVYDFRLSRQLYSSKVSLRDYDFAHITDPPPEGYAKNDRRGKIVNETMGAYDPSYAGHEIYEYPSSYSQYNTDSSTAEEEMEEVRINRHVLESRIDEAAMYRDIATGESTCARFCPGYYFKLVNHDIFDDNNRDNDKEYVLTEVIHTGSYSLGNGDTTFYNKFKGIPYRVTFRPERKTPKSIVRGPQTAIVVNSQGDIGGDTNYTDGNDNKIYNEVNTDEYGRVQVRFNWARPYDNSNYDSNHAWVRVSQAWAGQGWGSMHIPHVGQEVIVEFLDGDPDRPIITGRVYNGENEPHDDLKPQDHPHVSGIRDEYGNRLIMNSTPGEEEIRLYSPNQNSYLALGKEGAELQTDLNQWKRTLGDIVELGCGQKFEGFVGSELSTKFATSTEITVGSVLEAFYGNKIELSRGTLIEYKMEKEISTTDEDIDSSAKKDHILTAGDGFCVIGGARKQDNIPDDTHSGILTAYGESLTLSYGEFQKENAKKSLAVRLKENRGTITSVALILIGGILNGIIASATKPFEVDTDDYDIDKWNWWTHVATNSVLGIFSTIYSVIIAEVIKKYVIPDDMIEPKYHEEPSSIIGLNKKGITLGINYKKEAAGAQSNLAQAVQGVAGAAREEWKDKVSDILDPEKGTMDSSILMNEDGSITINSNGVEKLIEIGAGEKDGDISEISIMKDKIKLSCGKEGEYGKIEFNDDNGDVSIEHGGASLLISRDGGMGINAKGDSHLTSKTGDINITPGAGKKTKIKGLVDLG